MKRRDLLKAAAVVGAGLGAAGAGAAAAAPQSLAARDLARRLPRWRGFNLLEKFTLGKNAPFVETDFAWMRAWGFDFVRLPMDYRCWTSKDDPQKFDETVLKQIDQAVEFGRRHKVHVSLNLHRAPGFCINPPAEPLNLWTDEEARKQFDHQWAAFAKRYKGVPAAEVSFDLVNEPSGYGDLKKYVDVVRRAVEAIRRLDPDRLIIADGAKVGAEPVMEVADLGIAQSMHAYMPGNVTHYKAAWAGGDKFPEPTWPLKQKDKVLDRQWIYETRIAPWKKLEAAGSGVHVGEWGCYNKTPHAVVLAWARDVLGLLKEAGWGWALWNFRGSFGILDSGRADVEYEDFNGRKLDRKLLDLLREF
jgi:endoglucanase